MLYLLHKGNHPNLEYRGGQDPIVHLEADFFEAVSWANQNSKRWAFTSQNAGAYYFKDYNDLEHLDKVVWCAIKAHT